VDRRLNKIAVRVVSLTLLAAALAGGVYLGRDQPTEPGSGLAAGAVQDAAEIRLLKERHGEHAAARAYQRAAEGQAATKAAAEARTAAGRAHKLEQELARQKAERKRQEDENGGPTVPYAGPIPASCQEFSGNRKTGCAMMMDAGFPISQFPCLNKLWNKESGWNHRAKNPSSGAYGIPQAYPGDKMKSAGADWRNNPATQIKWGLGYIEGRYDNPCGAWARSERTGSY
jgi:hypothetical protein